MSTPLTVTGMAEIAGRYDAFLIDQFGVLRHGRGPYSGAAETLKRLKQAGKRVIVLSNSGKRSAENDVRLAELGFDPASWDWFLTSGEVAWRMMAAESRKHPQKCLLISRDGDISPLDGLDIVRTTDSDEADVILLAASEGDIYPLSYYRKLLEPAARKGVPCLCTNPDKIMLTATGEAFGAGRIAELYRELGGAVRFIGKPFPDIYATALDFLGHPDPARVCCVGDSVEHDIAGARGAGLGAVLVTTGILARTSPEERERLFAEHGATPDFIMPAFVW